MKKAYRIDSETTKGFVVLKSENPLPGSVYVEGVMIRIDEDEKISFSSISIQHENSISGQRYNGCVTFGKLGDEVSMDKIREIVDVFKIMVCGTDV